MANGQSLILQLEKKTKNFWICSFMVPCTSGSLHAQEQVLNTFFNSFSLKWSRNYTWLALGFMPKDPRRLRKRLRWFVLNAAWTMERGHRQITLTFEPVSIAKNHNQAPYFGAFHSLNATSYKKRSARIVPFPPCCTPPAQIYQRSYPNCTQTFGRFNS
jgi:hypothetical protein